MSVTPGRQRTVTAVAAVVVVVLALASATLIVAVANRRATVRNRAYGAVACDAPSLPGETVVVTLADRGNSMMGARPMMVTLRANPGEVGAGQVSFVVRNKGALAHELVILPLPTDGPGTRTTGADGKIDESQSLGEASKSCADGAGDGIAPGSTGWLTVTLKPGRYELVCDEPWHYESGMFDVLTVT
ncbi:MAG TPA: sulfocyanin-like copper-binding protein [Acidimicrobiales bacterium]